MRSRRIFVAAGLVALVCTVVGVLESYRLFRLISQEAQGHCDWMPCANSGTYLSLVAFLLLTAIGLAVALLTLPRQRKSH